jgi:hypothetical protein
MSMPDALASEARPYRSKVWRMVEAQHRVSTMRLTDNLEDQQVLEDLIEEVKPAYPSETASLHWLLKTPFRYSPYPRSSRFRRAQSLEGVFYASERVETAVAEIAFYRLLWLAEAPDALPPASAKPYTAFSVTCASSRAVDLTRVPFDIREADWTKLDDYAPCLELADAARAGGIEVIRYKSVRDPAEGNNVALLTPTAFADAEPLEYQTWHIAIRRSEVRAICEVPALGLQFMAADFRADPRLATL